MERHEEVFLNQRFSTTESAAILGIPAETFRTQVKQGWLPARDDGEAREPGKWRRFSPDDLLRCRLVLTLASCCVRMADAANVIDRLRPTFFSGDVFLYVARDADGNVVHQGQAGVVDFKEEIVHLAFAMPSVLTVVSVDLNREAIWVMNRIQKFNSEESEAL
jgi:hypothetical protein